LLTTIGVGLWFSALNVRYRDVRYVVAFLTQLWFFLTPIAYPSSFLEFPWRIFYGLNPMVGVVEGFRWVFLNSAPSHLMLGVSTITAIGIFLSGLFYFQKMEETFADEV
jgi:lipopolysaccharide transport system permease protein